MVKFAKDFADMDLEPLVCEMPSDRIIHAISANRLDFFGLLTRWWDHVFDVCTCRDR